MKREYTILFVCTGFICDVNGSGCLGFLRNLCRYRKGSSVACGTEDFDESNCRLDGSTVPKPTTPSSGSYSSKVTPGGTIESSIRSASDIVASVIPSSETLFGYWVKQKAERKINKDSMSSKVVVAPLNLAQVVKRKVSTEYSGFFVGSEDDLNLWYTTERKINEIVLEINTREQEASAGDTSSVWVLNLSEPLHDDSVLEYLSLTGGGSPSQILIKSDPLGTSLLSTVFEGNWESSDTTKEQYVVKYSNNCWENLIFNRKGVNAIEDGTDWLLAEYITLKTLELVGLIGHSPKAVSLSTVVIPSRGTWNSHDSRLVTEQLLHELEMNKSFVQDQASEQKYRLSSQSSALVGALCSDMLLSTMRGMVETPSGRPVSSYMQYLGRKLKPGKIPGASEDLIIQALVIGKQTIEFLYQLHKKGFMHGDVSSHTVVLRSLKDDPTVSLDVKQIPEIMMIEFGFSRFFPADMNLDNQSQPRDGKSNLAKYYEKRRRLLRDQEKSPWELGNERISRRCDIFRAIEMTAELLCPPGVFYRRVGQLYNPEFGDTEELMLFKYNRRYFSESIYRGKVRNGKESANSPIETKENVSICAMHYLLDSAKRDLCHDIMRYLDRALTIARNTSHADAEPDYEGILSFFEKSIALLLK